MCAGGQDIPVTLRVDGGIEDGQFKSSSDLLNTPEPQEDVQVTEATETEVMEPSSPLYRPVIERIDKLSERLPEKVAEETFEEVSPMMQHGFQMADRNQMNTMQMLDRIMRNTRPRKRFPPRGDGPLGKGGGRNDPRVPRPRYQTLGATPQVAGLAGLFGGMEKGINPEQIMATPTQLPNFPQQQGATPMQPEVIEEQQQMEILGQPKQFAGGGLVNALMATPIGQAELRKYANGGEIKFGDYIFDYGPTGDDPLDILRGEIYDDGRKARFFSSEAHMKDPSQPVVNWGRKDIVEQITEDLAPVRKKRRIEKEPDSDGETPGHEPDIDPVTGVQVGFLSEIDYDPKSGFKDYVDIPPIGIGGLVLGLLQKQYQKSLEYDPTKHRFPYNFGVVNPYVDPYNRPVSPAIEKAIADHDPDKARNPFGNAPQPGQISRGDIYGDSVPGLTDAQAIDVATQVDTFSEIGGDSDTDAQGNTTDAGGTADETTGGGW